MKQIFNVDKEFILAAYKVACDPWKIKIRQKFPAAFKTKCYEPQLVEEIRWKRGVEEKRNKFQFTFGDEIEIWDGSYNEDINGKHRSGIDSLFKNNTAKIIAINTGKIHTVRVFDEFKITLNLLVKFPNGVLVYVAPSMVNVIKKNEIEVDIFENEEEDKW